MFPTQLKLLRKVHSMSKLVKVIKEYQEQLDELQKKKHELIQQTNKAVFEIEKEQLKIEGAIEGLTKIKDL